VVTTWAYGDSVPGRVLRATVGDVLKVNVRNGLPQDTSVHWHGLALRNDMDGVPGVTQQPIRPGGSMTYEFAVPHPGTYFFHPHVGTQLDRGLYAPLVVDDPREPGRYDAEFTVVLDDWLDGTGRTPDGVLSALRKGGGMGGMDMGGMDMPSSDALGGDAGDVTYPLHLVNGRAATAPVTLAAKPGQRVRLRIINAGSDTAYRVALGGHRLTVTHTDGFPVRPVTVDTLLMGMGERYDVEVTLKDGVFPLVASAEGKKSRGLALIRTGAGRPPTASVPVTELSGRLLRLEDLEATDAVRLAPTRPDRTHDMLLGGDMASYRWTINGKTFDRSAPLPVRAGELVRLRFVNGTAMFHPMHVHGHTFQIRGRDGRDGPRKDTVIVRPKETVVADLVADNPGQWVTHCHNIYHAEAGMMVRLSYQEGGPA
jgi:FtsP/CotA-like multicopper oxidase with cupredoxin domain